MKIAPQYAMSYLYHELTLKKIREGRVKRKGVLFPADVLRLNETPEEVALFDGAMGYEAELRDALTFAQLAPSHPMAALMVIDTQYRYFLFKDKGMTPEERDTSKYRKLLSMADNVLSNNNFLASERASMLLVRSQLHEELDEQKLALEDLNEMMALGATPERHEYRARHWNKVGRKDLAQKDRDAAEALRKK